MVSLSIFTTMTDPEKRNDPWKEALECYNFFADEVVIVGKDWPAEFSWDHIGKTFQEGYDKCTSDWVMRMDIDYFLHEKNKKKLLNALEKYNSYPAISLPQYQIFTPDRYQIKTRICLLFNKKKYKNIKLNGGGDLTLATLDEKLIDPKKVPMVNVPIYQYESTFRTKQILQEDRGRFARAWYRYFETYESRGGGTSEEAFDAWFEEITKRYPKHSFKIKIKDHPKFIIDKLKNIHEEQFGYDAFNLKHVTKFEKKYLIKGLREKYLNPILYRKNIRF